MLRGLMNLFSVCWSPFGNEVENHETNGVLGGGGGSSGGSREGKDGFLWFRDIGKYGSGEFSMAVIQANQVLEDQSQIESGQFGTFVGIYDGHGGPEAARYVYEHLFKNFRAIAAESGGVVTAETIQRAFQQTEEGFTALVSELWSTRPNMATVGTCSLVGNTGEIAAIQLSTEHNANIEAIRHELKDLHPNDPQIVVLKHGVWRVKGIIQVSRSIGDVYMKHARYNREPINAKFRLPEPMNMPILSATPTIASYDIHPNDSFLIFASDGLWEHLSNEKAVAIVHGHPRSGSAKRLIKAALREAARKREMRYSDLWKIDKKRCCPRPSGIDSKCTRTQISSYGQIDNCFVRFLQFKQMKLRYQWMTFPGTPRYWMHRSYSGIGRRF
ncbi:probable protein phosphatase 2C 42 isoform X3 [Hibiscus syriacus]|uniref:probable protein phosphatase 2C 42 isoform X3 n=1 Tax=Hibiscus syriacus TaxID=106335 RepID=UPI001921725A|nr:probable protein phosphatase 2C 42 isoform X3 [Hibiscus syriacus]